MGLLPIIFVGLALLAATSAQTPPQASLTIHNAKRQIHGVQPLALDNNLNNLAQACAKYYAAKLQIDHTCPNKSFGANAWDVYGENLYWQSNGGDLSAAATTAANLWYAENAKYNYATGPTSSTNFGEVGHFTEMVWDNVTNLGVGVAPASNGALYVTALYKPSGNWMPYSNFVSHVFPPKTTG